jgi:hypothetical protein
MFQLRAGLSNGAESACCAATSPRRPRLRASVGAGPEHRKNNDLHFRGQVLEPLWGRTTRPEARSQFPQRRHLGFRDDGGPGQIVCAEQHFGKSALHFVLQQGGRLPSDRPCQRPVGRTAKPGADRHEAGGAHDGRRTNCEGGEASKELTPRDYKRSHLEQSPGASDAYMPKVVFRQSRTLTTRADLDCLLLPHPHF